MPIDCHCPPVPYNVARFTPSGRFYWRRQFGNINFPATDIHLSPNQTRAAVLATDSNGEPTLYYIRACGGDVLWQYTGNPESSDQPTLDGSTFTVDFDDFGNIIILFSHPSSFGPVFDHIGKFSPTGEMLWLWNDWPSFDPWINWELPNVFGLRCIGNETLFLTTEFGLRLAEDGSLIWIQDFVTPSPDNVPSRPLDVFADGKIVGLNVEPGFLSPPAANLNVLQVDLLVQQPSYTYALGRAGAFPASNDWCDAAVTGSDYDIYAVGENRGGGPFTAAVGAFLQRRASFLGAPTIPFDHYLITGRDAGAPGHDLRWGNVPARVAASSKRVAIAGHGFELRDYGSKLCDLIFCDRDLVPLWTREWGPNDSQSIFGLALDRHSHVFAAGDSTNAP